MKIRNGFVSNSSSSSFIVAIPKVEHYWSTGSVSRILGHDKTNDRTKALWQDIESYLVLRELEKRVRLEDKWEFEDEAVRLANVAEYENDFADDFADLVYDDVMSDESLNLKATEPMFASPEFEAWHDRFNAAALKRGAQKLQEFKAKYNDHWIIKFDFGDDSTVGAHMEHDDVFHAVPHIRFSHH